MEQIKEPYHHKERYERWLENKTTRLNKNNSKIFLAFIDDMSVGINIAKGSPKGARSPVRLNTLRGRLEFVIKLLEDTGISDIRKVTAKQLHKLFEDMRQGVIKTRTGTIYKSTGDYVKVFKVFWHWLQKVSKEKIEDITGDLDTRGEKPKFVYFTEKDFNNILEKASHDLKPALSLAFDSGLRVTELVNIKVSDFSNDFKELNIRDETSKTFGRKIKLMLCSEQIKKYIAKMELVSNDFLCRKQPPMMNKELRAIGKKVLTPEQIKFKNLSLYDFRHSSCCFWLPKYKSESALKYRFGWKKSDMIYYYSELMGMRDTISQEDLYSDITKTELEKEIENLKKDNEEKDFELKVTNKIALDTLIRVKELERRMRK